MDNILQVCTYMYMSVCVCVCAYDKVQCPVSAGGANPNNRLGHWTMRSSHLNISSPAALHLWSFSKDIDVVNRQIYRHNIVSNWTHNKQDKIVYSHTHIVSALEVAVHKLYWYRHRVQIGIYVRNILYTVHLMVR